MNKELIEKSTQDFIEIYKNHLHMVGIEAGSPAEKMMLSVLASSAKQWVSNVQYTSRKK